MGGGLLSPLKVFKMHYFDVVMPRNIIEKKRIQVKGESKKMMNDEFLPLLEGNSGVAFPMPEVNSSL